MKKADSVTFPDGTIQKTAAFYQAPSIPTGSKTNFQQAAAPTGWTQCTSYNNYAMRIVSGSGGGTGGSVSFTTAFASQTPSGSVNVSGGGIASTTLSTSQMPGHRHNGAPQYGTSCCGGGCQTTRYIPGLGCIRSTRVFGCVQWNGWTSYSFRVASQGCGSSHTHAYTNPSASFSGSAINLAVQYVDNIIAIKN